MLLTVPQKFIKGLIRDLSALKKNQVEIILKMHNENLNYKQTVMPLLNNGILQETGEFLHMRNGRIIPENAIAVDIMLRIESENIEVIQKGAKPINVTFFKKRNDKLWRFDIIVVKPGDERIITAILEGINSKYRTVVFVLENPEQQENLIAPCDYCFAWKKNGDYHFYKEVR